MKTEEVKIELCRNDFWLMLENACLLAGGGQVDKLKKMNLQEIADLLAHNGIRIVYMPAKHMNNVHIVWKEDSQSNAQTIAPIALY